MSVMGHIQELQRRFVVSAVFLIVGATLAYVFRDKLIHILLSPLEGQSLMYLNPAGGFSFILLVSVYVGLALAAPVTIYQLFCFVRPMLSESAQKKSLLVLLSSLALLAGGVAFGYVFAIPGALNFLYEFAGDYVQASLTADSYLNFVVAYTLGLGLVFQLPILLMLIHWINPLTPSGLLKSERWVILGAFLAAAIITPTPDPLNQTIIALPIVVIYQIGLVAVLLSIRGEKRQLAKLAAEEDRSLDKRDQAAVNSAHAVATAASLASVVQVTPTIAPEPAPITVSVPKPRLVSDIRRRPQPIKQGPVAPRKRVVSMDGFTPAHARLVATSRGNSVRAAVERTRSTQSLPVRPGVQMARPSTSARSIDGMSRPIVV